MLISVRCVWEMVRKVAGTVTDGCECESECDECLQGRRSWFERGAASERIAESNEIEGNVEHGQGDLTE